MLLCRDLRVLLTKQETQLCQPIGIHKRVAIALWWISGTSEYQTIAHLCGVGRSTAYQISREVYDTILVLLFSCYV